jgi:hypothetical protein
LFQKGSLKNSKKSIKKINRDFKKEEDSTENQQNKKAHLLQIKKHQKVKQKNLQQKKLKRNFLKELIKKENNTKKTRKKYFFRVFLF